MVRWLATHRGPPTPARPAAVSPAAVDRRVAQLAFGRRWFTCPPPSARSAAWRPCCSHSVTSSRDDVRSRPQPHQSSHTRPEGRQPLASPRPRQQRRSSPEGAQEEDAARGHFPRDEAPQLLREAVGAARAREGRGRAPCPEARPQARATRRPAARQGRPEARGARSGWPRWPRRARPWWSGCGCPWCRSALTTSVGDVTTCEPGRSAGLSACGPPCVIVVPCHGGAL